MADIIVDAWMQELESKLTEAFGSRLALVGLQGSRSRNEARPDSDIDSVVLIDSLSTTDLETCRSIIAGMPHADLACGFIGSPETVAAWPRHDVFNLVMDTRTIRGSFAFMDTAFTAEDALLSARVGASEIHHALCHTLAFEPEALDAVLAACVKNAFFVMRALTFARTGEYPESRARMRQLANDAERALLDAHDAPANVDADALLAWTAGIIQGSHSSAPS